MRSKRLASLVLGVTLGLSAGIGTAIPAFAAAPSNDDPAGAVAITTVPSTFTQNTTEATASADETALNSFCPAPTIEHGVWYQFTPTSNGLFRVDVTASDYSAGILVLSGSPGNLTPLNCGPGALETGVTTGETYYLLIFGDGLSAATSGDLALEASFRQTVPAPTIALIVDRRGTVDKQGGATISGTVTCTSTDGSGVLVDVFGSVRQTVGRIFLDGSFDQFIFSGCDGTPVRWAAYVISPTGKFAGGKAATVAIAFGCTDECSNAYTEATVQLSKARVR